MQDKTCAAGVTDKGDFVCQEDKGELWIGWITSLAQWAYTSGICLTILIPSFDLWRVSLLWSVGFSMLMTSAVVRDGMFETHWGGPFVLCSALLVRGADGYLETMIWRVIAHQYRPQGCEQHVVLFYGLMAMAVNLVGSTASDWLIQTGLIGD
jgi:type IV secretory pathway TrbD component